TTYKFPGSGGAASGATTSQNLLNLDLAVSHGKYYAATDALPTPTGVYSFDPATLAVGNLIAAFPQIPYGIIGDPLSDDPYVDTNNGNAVSVVASSGTRGDFATVGPDGCFYVTQTDAVVKLAPCFFQSPTADLSVQKTAPAGAGILQTFSYNILVTNGGPSPATNATLTDTLSAGVAFVSASSGQGSCNQSGGVVTCNLG